MKVFCTLSDIGYLDRGLVLYKSLIKATKEPFTLYYLCLDSETYTKLITLKLDNLVPYTLSSIEDSVDIKLAKENRDRKQYIFTLASYFTDYLIRNIECSSVMYMDSDIYFYRDPSEIINSCKGKHCGITLHRHNFVGHRDGGYNVGVVWFNNSKQGRAILSWWKVAVLTKEPKELSGMGDQKYLEAFIPLFGEESIKVLDEDIGHGAPWNFRLYVYDDYIKDGIIGWGDKKQYLVFNHFSQFKYSIEKSEITPDNNVYAHLTLNGAVFSIPEVSAMYMDYYRRLIEVNNKWL